MAARMRQKLDKTQSVQTLFSEPVAIYFYLQTGNFGTGLFIRIFKMSGSNRLPALRSLSRMVSSMSGPGPG